MARCFELNGDIERSEQVLVDNVSDAKTTDDALNIANASNSLLMYYRDHQMYQKAVTFADTCNRDLFPEQIQHSFHRSEALSRHWLGQYDKSVQLLTSSIEVLEANSPQSWILSHTLALQAVNRLMLNEPDTEPLDLNAMVNELSDRIDQIPVRYRKLRQTEIYDVVIAALKKRGDEAAVEDWTQRRSELE